MGGHAVSLLVKENFNKIFKLLALEYGKIYFDLLECKEGNKVGFILGEKFYFRVESDVGLFIMIKEMGFGKCLVDIISYAGGSGIYGISYHAHPNYVNNVINFLERNNIEFERIREINYLSAVKLKDELNEKLSQL